MAGTQVVGRTGLWRCGCGYLNLEGSSCRSCQRGEDGSPPLRQGQGSTGGAGSSSATAWAELRPPPVAGPRFVVTKAVGVVAAVLAFNVGVQLLVLNQVRDGHLSVGVGVTFALIGGLVFYVVTGGLVLNGIAAIGVRPVIVRGARLDALGAGALRGGLVAGGVVAVATAAGHGDVEQTTALLVGRNQWGLLVIATLLIAVAAPLVEELVFRGVLAESLRRWGIGLAITVSAAVFAVAHVHPGAPVPNMGLYLLYYFAAGRMLARVYFRRGLYGSIAAHAVFNATLVAATVLTLQGGAHTVTAGGVTARLPGGWHTVTAPLGDDLAAVGPQLSAIEIGHRDFYGQAPSADYFSAVLIDSGNHTQSPIIIDPSSVHHTLLRVGDAIEARGTSGHLNERLLVIPNGTRAWIIAVHSVDQTGDDDANTIINSLQLSSPY